MAGMRSKKTLLLSLGAALALAISGCASIASPTASPSGPSPINVVASTNVYGAIAEELGGDQVTVTSIIDSSALDPHSYEASVNDQLILSKADVIVLNGGGYDSYMEQMIEAANINVPVITAVEFSHDYPEHSHEDGDDHADEHADEHADDHDGHNHIEGFNEHVWYDPHVMEHLGEALAEEFQTLRPEASETFAANETKFIEGIENLEAQLASLNDVYAGTEAFLTEPLAFYLIRAAGLENVAPEAFTNAVEEGQDVAPAVLAESISLVTSGTVKIMVANTQTGGAETTRVINEAGKVGIPVVEFSETLPEGSTSYLSWMNQNIEQLATALEGAEI